MTNSRLLTVLFAFIILADFAPMASAHYDPGTGRWLERDPVGNPQATLLAPAPRYGQGGPLDGLAWSATAILDRSPGRSKAIARGELTNLYRYARSNPGILKDPLGLQPEEDPDVPGWTWDGPGQGENWEDWLEEYDRQMECCKCLVYAEGGNESPTCMEALVYVMWNRQNTGWPEHKPETSFCQQANQPAFDGGIKNRSYRNCRDCVGGLPPAEGQAMNRAEIACRKTMNPQRGTDPTGGAQYWYGPGYLGRTPAHWMHKQIQNGNCFRVNVPGCKNEFYKCKSRPLA